MRRALYSQLKQFFSFKKLSNTSRKHIYSEIMEILPPDWSNLIKSELKDLILENNNELEAIFSSNKENTALEFLAQEITKSIPYREKSLVSYLSELKKPIIMHNGSIDSLHLFDKFIERLPPTISEFKQKFHKNFPSIYDTKHILRTCISLSPHFKNEKYTSLGEAYYIVSNNKHFRPE